MPSQSRSSLQRLSAVTRFYAFFGTSLTPAMGSGVAGYGALTVPNPSSGSKVNTPSTKNALASGQSASPLASDTPNTGPNPQRAANAAIISLSVVLSIAMIAVITWYLRLRRQETLRLRLGSERSSSSHTRNGGGSESGTRYVKPLKTSFHPSFKSSFGFGPSPDSPWSRTEGTITPLTRAAGQEFLYSPVAENGSLSSPEVPISKRHAQMASNGILSPPPVTSTNRTFRTSIHSLMVNRDSMTTNNPSLSEDLFSNSKRPRTRLPSYHTDYAKSSQYAVDLKNDFIPGPVDPPPSITPPSTYVSQGDRADIPPVPTLSRVQLSRTQAASPTPVKTRPLKIARPSKAPLAPIKTRQSLKEYLGNDHGNSGMETPSSTASRRVRVNSSARPSISSSYALSEELRGLLFLAPSVVVDDRPMVRRPADPDLSPTQGWTKLPDTVSSRRLA